MKLELFKVSAETLAKEASDDYCYEGPYHIFAKDEKDAIRLWKEHEVTVGNVESPEDLEWFISQYGGPNVEKLNFLTEILKSE